MSVFDSLLSEAESATPAETKATIREAFSAKAKSELLWHDGMLDQLPPIRSKYYCADDLVWLTNQFVNLTRENQRYVAEIALYCVASMTDVFNGKPDDLFPVPPSLTGRVTEGPASAAPWFGPAHVEDRIHFVEDLENPLKCMGLVVNAEAFYNWLLNDVKRVRPILGIISLALLGLATEECV